MNILALDCGSSSIKAAVMRDGKVRGKTARGSYHTKFDGVRAEVDPTAVLAGLEDALKQLGPAAKKVDLIALDVMAPSWLAMDKKGKPLTPIITHQDRRSVKIAREIEKKVGEKSHLRLTGNRPFPGGISSTTWAWFVQNQPAVLKKADLVGHLSTFLHRTLTGARVTDPSNASFMGVYNTLTLKGWNDTLCDAIGANQKLLPEVHDGIVVGGTITAEAAGRFGLTEGLPMLVGVMDTSATLLLHGAAVGTLLNVSGTTDVLALCTDKPKPSPQLLTRALGSPAKDGGQRWMQVSTIAAAGATFNWLNQQLFRELQPKAFYKLLEQNADATADGTVRFDPYLAGSRTSLDQKTGAFTGLTLASTREEMLRAAIHAIADASAARLPLLEATGTKIHHDVLLSGGVSGGLHKVLHRGWPGHWRYNQEDEATMRGLAVLAASSGAAKD